MRNLKYPILILISVIIYSCKKNEIFKSNAVVTINVINAVPDMPNLKAKVGTNASWGLISDQITFNSNRQYFSTRGTNRFQIVQSIDTNKFIVDKSINLKSTLYSYFLSGTLSSYDTLLVEEANYPIVKVGPGVSIDSIVNVRFINLSNNSPILKVNIRNSTVNEVENLEYKSVGKWKPYPNKSTATTNYIFEVRNSSTNVILSTYTFGATSTNRFKNVSLIIKGQVGITTGNNAFGIFPANYF